ncbi:hypothetical protein FQR65_LT03281 [Abscondita terminalis]|nr:hypothetical protein FQR65_LT03281 [Abscondita terminalis]
MLTDLERIVTSKAVILGDQGVGKTSLVLRYVEHKYNNPTSPTIGASYFSCSIPVEDVILKLQIWDTAGQERFRSMAPLFYRNSNAALLVFDITNTISFYNIQDWVLELKGNIEEPIVICVVGTKSDLQNQRLISKEEAIRFSNKIGANYYECSALNDKGIEHLFRNVAMDLVKLTGELLSTKTLNACDGLSVDSSIGINTIDCGTVIFPSTSKENIAHGTTTTAYLANALPVNKALTDLFTEWTLYFSEDVKFQEPSCKPEIHFSMESDDRTREKTSENLNQSDYVDNCVRKFEIPGGTDSVTSEDNDVEFIDQRVGNGVHDSSMSSDSKYSKYCNEEIDAEIPIREATTANEPQQIAITPNLLLPFLK